jgi:tripartite-type tricarboxylate transporter receptor subunit TctC
MTRSRREVLQFAAAASTLAFPSIVPASVLAQAQDFPNKNLVSICPFPAGSGADVFVRFYGDQLAKRIGKPVIVENRPGANGMIATNAVAQARPDGYTIAITPGSAMLAAAPHLFKTVPYDPVKDFEHVTTLARLAFVFTVAPSSPAKTMAELTALLRAKGDKGSYGTTANTGVVSGALYMQAFGLKSVEVKYGTAATAINDLLGGNLDFVLLDPVPVREQATAGRIRPLAVSSATRMSALPELPSTVESGMRGVDVQGWWSVHTPARTPKPIVDKLETLFNDIVAGDEAKKFLANLGSDPLPGTQRSVRELLEREIKAWGEHVALAKIEKL